MLCVGVGGSGRQSLTRLASHIMAMQTFQIEVCAARMGENERSFDCRNE